MTKRSPSFIMNAILRVLLICLTLFRSCDTRNSFFDLDLSSQTLNPGVTGFKMTGSAASNYLGQSIRAAGDIDNDGYDDIIVGAYGKNSNQGIVYVIYGGAQSAMSDWDFSSSATLNPLTTGFTITGNAANDWLGYSVSTAGDIDNDGYDDIIIGAYYKNTQRGAVYVIYGGTRSSRSNVVLSSTTLSPTSTGFTMTGYVTLDSFGFSVSTAGDINNDGYDDIIIGAPNKNGNGAAYMIYGGSRSSRSNWDFSSGATLNPLTTGFLISGSTGSSLGFSVNTAGDINKDGYDDIIVGGYGRNSNQGVAYVIYGRDQSLMSNWDFSSGTTLTPSTTGFMITGNAANDQLGISVSTAGDINKDGYDDIIVGAYQKNSNQGAVYLIYGGEKSTMSNIALSSTPLNPASTGFMITGNSANNQFGRSVSTAGDINRDGYDDIIIGAPQKNSYQGAAYVIYGGPKSSMSNIALSSTTLNPLTTGFMVTGAGSGDNFGFSVSRAGDFNKDGFDDIVIGAATKNTNQGAAYLIYASCSQSCKQCSSESFCTQCQTSYLLYQGECFASCPDATLQTSSTICEDCPTHCKHCSSTSVCTECKDSYILYQFQFQCLDTCPDTMYLSTTTCEDCPLHCNHCTSDSLCTECISPFVLYDSQCLTSCPKAMFNSTNVCKDCPSYCSSCISQDSCQVCIQGYTLSNSLCILSGAQEKALKTISSATQGLGSIVCVGSSIFPFSALVAKIVQNTRYLNLSVPSDLTEVYQTWDSDLISWDIPNVFSNADHFEASPPLFAQYDVGSPFLVNFWPTILNIGIGFGTFIACILLQKVFEHEKYEGWAHSLNRKLIIGSFNFALVQAYACLDDILFYLVLDGKTNPFNSFFSWTSMVFAVIFLVLGCLLVFFNFWTVNKYQSIKNQGMKEIENFNQRNAYWELFYSDFIDDDLWCQSFFAFAIIRSVLSSFTITVFYDYPLMQTSYLLTMDGAIILFLYFKNPFNTLRGKLAQYYYETITLLVHFCAFILSLQDTFDNPSDTVKKIMSTGILYLNTALISGAIGFMFIEIYEILRLKDKAQKRKQRQSIPEDTQEIQNLTVQDSSNNQKRNDFINMESSRTQELNFNAESSRELDMYPSHRISQQRNQNTRPRMIQQRNSFVFPSHAIHNEQF